MSSELNNFTIFFRNLFKKVALLMKTHQIPLEAFLVALRSALKANTFLNMNTEPS